MTLHVPPKAERGRVTRGEWASSRAMGPNGMFHVKQSPRHQILRVILSRGMGWEHASVSAPGRCPTWDEMEWIKRLFWHSEDAVVQIHPPESEYVNHHPYTLHLWRPIEGEIPRPPAWMVGPLT